ncbi:methyl-accepting chemotaxis protein [Priestia abyssalis]|uniref:methyl-accepting chemotaxis protein n=1 Tax=Priestia abyssalis TaxID=1221450 RepID=UPI001F43AA59|nr:methyl-accepting chemotaxis protein [Priestia abyssalis]
MINDHVLSQFDNRLQENGKTLASAVDSELINHTMENPAEYGEDLKQYLDSFIKERKGIEYVYVLSKENDKDVIVALNGSDDFMVESPFTKEQKQSFEQKSEVLSSIYTDQWGVHKSFFTPVDNTNAIIGIDMDAAFIDALQKQVLLYSTLFLIAAVFIGGLLAIYIGSRISNPINRLVRFTKVISSGNLGQTIDIKREDEIGLLSNSFEEMRQNLRLIIDSVREKSQTINETSNNLLISFEELEGASQQIVTGTNEEAHGAEERAKHIEHISNMTTEMSAAIENMDNQTKQIKEFTHHTSKLSEKGYEQVSVISDQINKIKHNGATTKENLSKLNHKLEHINRIIDLIREISSQTNLLSLNASIEAARAGEAGKGFSVVAQEIQKLANQTAASIKDISDTIDEINKQTNKVLHLNQQDFEDIVKGVEIVEDNGRLFNEIFQSVEQLKSRSDIIFTSSSDIARASDATLSSIQEIAAITEQSVATAQEIAAAAVQQNSTVETLKYQNHLLKDVANVLQGTVGRFKIDG